MTRSPLFLAALASSAVPGLDPVLVEAVRTRPDDPFEVAHVTDSQDRLWAVKVPRTQAAGAALEDVTRLCHLLGRRLEVAIPMVRGQVTVPEGRAVVYLRVPGRSLDFASLPPGPLAGEVGRALAHIHNVEHLLFEEAGLVSYDAEGRRRRQLSELDRAAATGHVPTNLLTRWEHSLEDVSLWRFAPCPVHGTFVGENVLASFDDEADAATGRVRGVLAWEEAHIGDPADDFAELIAVASPDAVDSVLEAYAQSRVERPDANLVSRARLAGEMTVVRTLLRALSAGLLGVVEQASEALRALDEQTEAEDRRHEREDAARLERDRLERSEAFAAAEAAAGRSRPADLPDDAPWDATAPHVPSFDPDAHRPAAAPNADPVGSLDAVPSGAVSDGAVSDGAVSDGAVVADDRATQPHIPTPDWSEPATPEQRAPDSADSADEPRTQAADDGGPAGGPPPVAGAETDAEAVPVLDRHDATSFEIDQAEALPGGDTSSGDDDAAGADDEFGVVVDEHEGASAFVPTDPADTRDSTEGPSTTSS
ncbi:MAG: phosphotransferase [Humibacillus sp.]|nr:phosphotransferase [Humibacillus sp.]MDN5778717.1 phosphotransferase [Humibacillus sp.]